MRLYIAWTILSCDIVKRLAHKKIKKLKNELEIGTLNVRTLKKKIRKYFYV